MVFLIIRKGERVAANSGFCQRSSNQVGQFLLPTTWCVQPFLSFICSFIHSFTLHLENCPCPVSKLLLHQPHAIIFKFPLENCVIELTKISHSKISECSKYVSYFFFLVHIYSYLEVQVPTGHRSAMSGQLSCSWISLFPIQSSRLQILLFACLRTVAFAWLLAFLLL